MTPPNGALKATPAAEVKITLKAGYALEGSTPTASNRFVYCWQEIKGSWKPCGILLSKEDGTLYFVDDYIRSEFRRIRNSDLRGTKPMVPDITAQAVPVLKPEIRQAAFTNQVGCDLFSEREISVFFDVDSYAKPYSFIPGEKYFLAFFPIELIFNKFYQSAEMHKTAGVVDQWANAGGYLVEKPDPSWLVDTRGQGTLITVGITWDKKLLPIQVNAVEWLRSLYALFDGIARQKEIIEGKTAKSFQASSVLKTIIELIDVTETYKEKDTFSDGTWRRENAKRTLSTMAKKIDERFNHSDLVASEVAAITDLTNMIIDLLRSPDLQAALNFTAESNSHTNPPFLSFLRENAVRDIITESFCMIADCPAHGVAEAFFKTDIIQFLISMAMRVKGEDLKAVYGLLFTQSGGMSELSQQFIGESGNTNNRAVVGEVKKAFVDTLDSKALLDLFGKDLHFDITPNKKDVLVSCTKLFSKELKESNTAVGKIVQYFFPVMQDIVLDKIKEKGARPRVAGISAFFMRSVFGLSDPKAANWFKLQVLNPTQWYKRGPGEPIPPAPRLVFSSVALYFSAVGIAEYFQKDTPSIEDKFNLYLSLSAGALDLGKIVNPSFKTTPLGKVLDNIYSPLKAVSTFKNGIDFMLKADQCYKDKDPIEGTINALQCGISLADGSIAIINQFLKMMFLEQIQIKTLGVITSIAGYWALIAAVLQMFYKAVIETKQHKIAANYCSKILVPWFEKSQATAFGAVVTPAELHELTWTETPNDQSMTATNEPIKWDWHGLKKLIAKDIAAPDPTNMFLDKFHFIAWVPIRKNDPGLLKDLLARGFNIADAAGLMGKKVEEVKREYEKEAQVMIRDIKDTAERLKMDRSARNTVLSKYNLI